jgi:predicted TIM-barrel fold metal-dependent hydrolase
MTIDRIVSADSHFLEPPTLWTERLPEKFRERGPHTFTTKTGVVFLTGEDMEPQPVAGWCAAGRAEEAQQDLKKLNRMGWDAAPKGAWTPADRLEAQDRDGILAEIMFTSFGMIAMNIKDVALATACLSVFNDYASEFCSYDPKRLIGIGAVIPDDVEAAVKELNRIRKMGLRGVMLPLTLQDGENYGSAKYDPIWAACEEMGLVVSFHAGTSRQGINPEKDQWPRLYAGSPHLMQMTLTDIMFGGTFDRFPRLKISSVENDVSWLAHFAYRMDHFAERFVAVASVKLKLKPSDYIKRHFYSTFQFEGPGIDAIRKTLGSEIMMWGNDFPHLDSTWPNSPKLIKESLIDIMPEKDVENIVFNNVVRLYELDIAA